MSNFEFDDAELLRFTTAGSVDDGKSTLIGRLLYDSKSVYEDVLESITATSKKAGKEEIDLALMTDGLRSEREQGITIDVAYRYFSTPKRRFIIADTPGHEQYTRNMVTGASNANLAIILIDASKGVLPQSRRHAILASLLRIPHVVVAVNKMDLVDWDQETYDKIEKEFSDFTSSLGFTDIRYIPLSALTGDNVVERSENMNWYDGATLMHHLEHVHIEADRNLQDFRLPIQTVLRPHSDYRGFAGRIESGIVKVGDEVVSLPSGKTSKVKSIDVFNGTLEEAFAPQSVSITLEDEIDTSRGDMLSLVNNQPRLGNEIEASVCWMSDQPMLTGRPYIIKHTTRETRAMIVEVEHRLDINTLAKEKDVNTLKLNEVGRIKIKTQNPLSFDAYSRNRQTGSFIIIDPQTYNTVAAGMISGLTDQGLEEA
ncbi:MAG: sulfate adenylyltransferase subunit CysN [Lentisphaeraceae bacterium]|nr:sulfate adenylyltransferase subunit CysN [Lentisphaeraceae bacterium]